MRLYASKERWHKEAAEDAAEDPWLLNCGPCPPPTPPTFSPA